MFEFFSAAMISVLFCLILKLFLDGLRIERSVRQADKQGFDSIKQSEIVRLNT